MTPRITAPLLAGLASVAIVVAACGGNTASTAPTAPLATATAVPVTAPPVGTEGPGASFDLSSFHADADLEELFPDEVGGVALNPISMSGQAMLAGGGSPELEQMLAALNKTAADLSAAFAGTVNLSIVAFQVDGASGGAILDALFDVYGGETATITDATFGGKALKKIVFEGETSYVYAAQDVVFLVTGTSAVTDAMRNEIFSKLP